jgi:hypothetical protein
MPAEYVPTDARRALVGTISRLKQAGSIARVPPPESFALAGLSDSHLSRPLCPGRPVHGTSPTLRGRVSWFSQPRLAWPSSPRSEPVSAVFGAPVPAGKAFQWRNLREGDAGLFPAHAPGGPGGAPSTQAPKPRTSIGSSRAASIFVKAMPRSTGCGRPKRNTPRQPAAPTRTTSCTSTSTPTSNKMKEIGGIGFWVHMKGNY